MRTLLESNAQHLGLAVQTKHRGRPSWRHQPNYPAGLLLLGIACGCSSSSSNNSGGGGQATASGGTTAAAAGNTSAGGNNGTGGSAHTSAGTTSNNAGGNSAGGAGGNSAGGAGGGTAGSSSTCCSISSACNTCMTSALQEGGVCWQVTTPLTSPLPPCENMSGTNPYTGQSNADLCKAVYSCVMSTQCAFTGTDFEPNACYCGASNIGSLSACILTHNGPCMQQIADGMNEAVVDPTSVIANSGDLTTPTGMALFMLFCESNSTKCGSQCGITFQGAGTGGASGTGGAPSTGGAPATGGAGTGGYTSTGCTVLPGDTILYPFDEATDVSEFNVVTNSGWATPSFVWDSSADSASNATSGSLKVSVTFDETQQKSEIDATLPSVIDLTNKTLFACVRLDMDLDSDGGSLQNSSLPCGSNVFALGAISNIGVQSKPSDICSSAFGQWLPYATTTLVTTILIDQSGIPVLDASGNQQITYNSRQISKISLQFSGPFGALKSIPPQTVTYHVDTIGYR